MRLRILVAVSATIAACQCAELPQDLRFKCEHDSECLMGTEVCGSDGFCAAKGSAGGGSGGGAAGGTSGGAAGGTAGGAAAGGAAGAGGGGTCIPVGGFDWPDDNFTDSNCDGIDGTIQGGVFVHALRGQPGNPGTLVSPVKTLEEGLRLAADAGSHSIFVASNTYSPSTTLRWSGRASIFGGYDIDWQRVTSRVDINGAPIAMVLDGDAGRTLMNVNVSSASTGIASQPSIALIIDGASLTLMHVNVRAGDGADGGNGTTRLTPPIPLPGGNGAPGQLYLDGGLPTLGGAGVAGCGTTGLMGGNGGTDTLDPTGGLPVTGGGGAAGGNASVPLIACSACPCNSGANNWGSDGNSGGPGSPGAPGSATSGGGALGFLDGGMWFASTGGAGLDGTPGDAGASGGGGGSVFFTGGTGSQFIGGSSGGAGGTGGCGGLGGLGGGGGGASIAVLLRNGYLNASIDTALSTGRGGNGGAGAPGSSGGPGGLGGTGGPIRHPVCAGGALALDAVGPDAGKLWAGAGGDGGLGGTGGQGGPGSGGGGGPSIVVYCGPGASGALDSGRLDAGAGGAGGPGAPGGQPGSNGTTATTAGCLF